MGNPPDVRCATFGEGDGILGNGESDVIARYKSNNQSFTTGSFEDDNELSFPVVGSAAYIIRVFVIYSTSLSGEAYDMSLNGPAGPLIMRYMIALNTTATARTVGTKTTFNSGLGLTSGFGTTVLQGEINGFIVVPAGGGDLVVRHKTETGGGESATVYAGSHGVLRRVA